MRDQEQQKKQYLKNVGGRGRDQLVGLVMIFVVITCWVASSFVLKGLFETGVYEKPFFVTYLNVSSLTLYLVPYWLRQRKTGSSYPGLIGNDADNSALVSSDEEKGQTAQTQLPLEPCDSTEVSVSEILRLSLTFCILWFLACFTTNTSLSYTSVSSQTILSSTSSLFTLLIGSLAAVERITKHKFYGVVVSFIGVILVTKADSIRVAKLSSTSNGNNPEITRLTLLGDALALIGAVVYGIYSTLLRKSVEDKSGKNKNKNKNKSKRSLDLHLFFGFVGAFTMLGLWPLLVLLHITGFETFQVPSSWGLLFILALSAGITFISDYCWAKAVLLTSPLTVSMGLSISIPLAMLVSLVSKFERSSFELSYAYILGAMMVLVSFIIVNREQETSTEEECEEVDDNAVVEIDEVPSSTTLLNENVIRLPNYGSVV